MKDLELKWRSLSHTHNDNMILTLIKRGREHLYTATRLGLASSVVGELISCDALMIN